jgi:hypothetical protein
VACRRLGADAAQVVGAGVAQAGWMGEAAARGEKWARQPWRRRPRRLGGSSDGGARTVGAEAAQAVGACVARAGAWMDGCVRLCQEDKVGERKDIRAHARGGAYVRLMVPIQWPGTRRLRYSGSPGGDQSFSIN